MCQAKKGFIWKPIGFPTFWKKISATLIEWDFTVNPYEMCVAKKEINGEKNTILWYVNDLKYHMPKRIFSRQ